MKLVPYGGGPLRSLARKWRRTLARIRTLRFELTPAGRVLAWGIALAVAGKLTALGFGALSLVIAGGGGGGVIQPGGGGVTGPSGPSGPSGPQGPPGIVDAGGIAAIGATTVLNCDFTKQTPQAWAFDGGIASLCGYAGVFSRWNEGADATTMGILPDGGGLWCQATSPNHWDATSPTETGPIVQANLSTLMADNGIPFTSDTRVRVTTNILGTNSGTVVANEQPTAGIMITDWPFGNTTSASTNRGLEMAGLFVIHAHTTQAIAGEVACGAPNIQQSDGAAFPGSGLTNWQDATQFGLTMVNGAGSCASSFNFAAWDGGFITTPTTVFVNQVSTAVIKAAGTAPGNWSVALQCGNNENGAGSTNYWFRYGGLKVEVLTP